MVYPETGDQLKPAILTITQTKSDINVVDKYQEVTAFQNTMYFAVINHARIESIHGIHIQ